MCWKMRAGHWPCARRYLSWLVICCAIYSANCGLRQEVERGHLSKFWDS